MPLCCKASWTAFEPGYSEAYGVSLGVQINLNADDIVHESLDGEVVIVNLRNGRYYSLADVGAEFWAQIVTGSQVSQLVASARSRYADDGQIEAEVDKFLQELVEEGLIRLSAGEAVLATAHPAPDAPPFQAPVLSKHKDMEGLLLLDPVHEVSDQGWPSVSAQ